MHHTLFVDNEPNGEVNKKGEVFLCEENADDLTLKLKWNRNPSLILKN